MVGIQEYFDLSINILKELGIIKVPYYWRQNKSRSSLSERISKQSLSEFLYRNKHDFVIYEYCKYLLKNHPSNSSFDLAVFRLRNRLYNLFLTPEMARKKLKIVLGLGKK
jgi:hypothetical protein